ncbi:MAG: DNA repair protein RadC [Anaerolineae bacterium]|nr:DNA repair protein RadC [Anaerolineae bacterium]
MTTKRKRLTDAVNLADLTLSKWDNPFDSLTQGSPASCSLVELLQVVIGGPRARQAASDLLARCPDLRELAGMSTQELATLITGIGLKKSAQLKACLELGRRWILQDIGPRPLIKAASDAAAMLIPQMGLLEQEEVHTLLLDARNRLMASVMTYRGTLSSAEVKIGEVFKEAIRRGAASILVAHNHPSTDPSPSAEDVLVTKELIRDGELLGIDVLDHLVIGGNRFVSLRERGLAFQA